MAAKKTASKKNKTEKKASPTKSGGASKSEFIRKNIDLPTAALVAKARAAGLSISPTLVYVVRGRVRRKAGGGAKRRGRPSAPKSAPSPRATTTDVRFRKLVLDLGVGNARRIIDKVEARLAQIVGG